MWCGAVGRPDPRVLFVSSHSSDGGSEGHLRRLLNRIGSSWVAGVICLQDGPLVSRLRADGWPVHVVPTGPQPIAVLRSARALRRQISAERPDVVHANGVKAAIAVLLARPSVPVVWNKHDHAFDGAVGRAVAARCAAVVGVSGSAVRTVESAAAQVVVLPPLVDPPRGDAAAGRSRLQELSGAGPSTLIVVCVGRIERAKGQLDVVEALGAVRGTDLDVGLVLVGGCQPREPGHLSQVMARARTLGLADVVHATGFRDDAADLIAGADALVVASHPVDRRGMGAEGYGLVAVEAMALGTPVVAYAAGALPEVVGDCASLVPVCDRAALGRALREVLTDPARARRMVACGRERAAPVLDGAATVDGLRALYRSVSGEPNR